MATITTPVGSDEKATAQYRGGTWIEHWEPDNPLFWERTGKTVARRNLIVSIICENIGFSVWLLWSIVVVSLPKAGFQFSVDQLFWLVSIPTLVGSLIRIPYTFAVPIFGGRNWTIVSALLLLVPTLGLAYAVSNPETSFLTFVLIAAAAGFGGGNFASSMANISFFFPEKSKGLALGLNAAGGNIGVAVVQLLVPLVIAIGGGLVLARAGLMWIPLILLSALLAFKFMNNLHVSRTEIRPWLTAARRKHTWIMSALYIGTFGSFIGYSAAFPLLIKTEFTAVNPLHFAFLGPLVGSIARPFGGWLADRLGGARVTAWTFVAMAGGAGLVLVSLGSKNWALFLGSFLVLFIGSGAGNGATYRMIPAIFRATLSARSAKIESAAAIGISASIGAIGGFFVPRIIASSIANTGSPGQAFAWFVVAYGGCLVLTWAYYLRRIELPVMGTSLARDFV